MSFSRIIECCDIKLTILIIYKIIQLNGLIRVILFIINIHLAHLCFKSNIIYLL